MDQDSHTYERDFLEGYLVRIANKRIEKLQKQIESIGTGEQLSKTNELKAKIEKIKNELENDLRLLIDDPVGSLTTANTSTLDFGLDDLLDDFSSCTFVQAYRRAAEKYCSAKNVPVPDFDGHLYKTQVEVRSQKIPSYLWESLFEYQKEGVSWLVDLFNRQKGGVLADDMGLGKTIQCIVFISSLIYNEEIRSALIICPATLINQWMFEWRRFFPFVTLYSEFRVIKSKGVYFTSYSKFVKLSNLGCDLVVLDEGHKIKNKATQVAASTKSLRTLNRFVLTGTPIQNNLSELWSIFDFINPNLLGSYTSFYEEFELPILEGGYKNASHVQVDRGYRHSVMLRSVIEPFILRRMKSEVKHELPGKIEKVLFCSLSKKQVILYKQALDSENIRKVLTGKRNVLYGIDFLRKICNHPLLVRGKVDFYDDNSGYTEDNMARSCIGETSVDMDHHNPVYNYPNKQVNVIRANMDTPEEGLKAMGESYVSEYLTYGSTGHEDASECELIEDSAKLKELHKMIRLWAKEENKILIFTQTIQMLDIIAKSLGSYKFIRMDGTTQLGRRSTLIRKFNTDPSISIFLLTIKVGGLGLNLCSANRIIIYDPDWNPSTDTQAKERVWRYGQRKDVEIYRFICRNTIEEKIYQRQIFKDLLSKKILSNPKLSRFYTKHYIGDLFEYVDMQTETEIKEVESRAKEEKNTLEVREEHLHYFTLLKEWNEKPMLTGSEMLEYIRIREIKIANEGTEE